MASQNINSLFVSPNRTPVSGNYVIVKLIDEKEAKLKQLFLYDDKIVLRSLNPLYPEMLFGKGRSKKTPNCGRRGWPHAENYIGLKAAFSKRRPSSSLILPFTAHAKKGCSAALGMETKARQRDERNLEKVTLN